MVVYGVQCGENSRLSCDQIVNRVRDIFGVDVSENLTANNTPENIEILNGEPGMYSVSVCNMLICNMLMYYAFVYIVWTMCNLILCGFTHSFMHASLIIKHPLPSP